MKRLRTWFGIDDELQAFAERWLNTGGSLCGAHSLTAADGSMVACLYRDGAYQVELCTTPAGMVIPEHIHPHADTIEVSVAGALRLTVNGVDAFEGMSDEAVARVSKWRGLRINHNDWHGTTVGAPGAMFLSIQKWLDGVPRSVLTDYEGGRLGPQHECL